MGNVLLLTPYALVMNDEQDTIHTVNEPQVLLV